MRRRFCIFQVLLTFPIFLALATGSWAQSNEVRVADSKGDWGHPNPWRHYPRGPGYVRMSWVFDTLVWKDEKGMVPALAGSWHYEHVRKAFVFQMVPGAKWHDGKPVTPNDVVFTVEYFKKNPYGWVVLDHVDRAEATGPHEVTFFLKRPYAPFMEDVGGTMPILPKHVWEKVQDPKEYGEPAAFIGSGPFLFRDFDVAKGTYLYVAFPEYYQGRPKVDRLIYVKAADPVAALLSGQANLANIQPEMRPLLEERGMTVIGDKAGWVKKLMINHRVSPLSHKRFRQALAHAISQEEILQKAHRGRGRPASYGLLSVDHDDYNPKTPGYAHDPSRARQILESMGFQRGPDGFYHKEGKPLKLELLASSITVAGQPTADRDGEVIRQQLESVGIRVELRSLEQTTTDAKVRNWDFQLAISGHGGIMGDPKILNEMISEDYAAGSVNSVRFQENKELLDLLEAQMVEMDPAQRRAMVHRIQEIFAEELPSICLYYPETLSAYDPNKGIRWFYTKGGISKGIPIPQNKLSLLR